MSKKHSLCLWKKDGPEPDWYAQHKDPLHKTDPNSGCSDLTKLIEDLTSVLKNWVENPRISPDAITHAISFDVATNALKQGWFKAGGSPSNYDLALEQAFLKSGYYKNFK